MTDYLSLSEVQSRLQAGEAGVFAEVPAQVEDKQRKQTSTGNPYWELRVRDAESTLILRAWHDTPAFSQCEELSVGAPIAIKGEFVHQGNFGLEARRWELRFLTEEERLALFSTDNAQDKTHWQVVEAMVAELGDPRLRALSELFLSEYGMRFRRAAAARRNHHARRGGLMAHTAQMLRAAASLCSVYPQWNKDLLLTGILFHDCGKLWETCPPEEGFGIPFTLNGELLGHIMMGAEVVNALWRRLPLDSWDALTPGNEEVRRHLLHLIVSHHGTHEFGSPVLPRTPEAFALHFLDNLDAKMEAFRVGYAENRLLAEGIFEKARILPANLVAPLPDFHS